MNQKLLAILTILVLTGVVITTTAITTLAIATTIARPTATTTSLSAHSNIFLDYISYEIYTMRY